MRLRRRHADEPRPQRTQAAAAWFDLDELPPMTAGMRRRITLSAGDDERTVFDADG